MTKEKLRKDQADEFHGWLKCPKCGRSRYWNPDQLRNFQGQGLVLRQYNACVCGHTWYLIYRLVEIHHEPNT